MHEERIEIPVRISLRETGKMTAHFGEVHKVHTDDYEDLFNKPSIEGKMLVGDQSFKQLGLGEITEQDIDEIIFGGD